MARTKHKFNWEQYDMLQRCSDKKDMTEWNKWRKKNIAVEILLEVADLERSFLVKANLKGACLIKANLPGANLEKANLEGADLSMANLCLADLSKSNLNKAILSDSYLNRSILSGANLIEADLCRTDLSLANLSNANLTKAELWEANLSRVNLSGANLSGANLSNADLDGSVLVETNLSRANIRRATLMVANLSRANLIGANLRGANLAKANLRGANLIEADLRGSMHNDADLTDANLSEAIFTPEGSRAGIGTFFDLSSCRGLETAKFSEPDFLQNYLARAFEYAHRPDTYEAKEFPEFVELALDNIKALRALFADTQPPKEVIEVVHVITSELLEYLKKHPKAMYEIRPRQFEELIAEILASYGWQVNLTQATRDGGYDIYAISPVKGQVATSWIIECKKYRPENKVGLDVVRTLYGLRMDLQVANAMLATTSHFSRDAQAYKASRYDLKLKDYSGILEWINEYRPNPNGKLYIKDNKLILPGED